MKLLLVALPSNLRGIYGASHDQLGAQQLWAHPDLAAAIEKMEKDGVRAVFSDIFRSAKGSLDARRAKPGLVQPPGYSAHNFGLAADLDYAAMLKELRLDKKALDWLLEGYGLYCHRKDHAAAAEAWHHNCLGPDPARWLQTTAKSTAGAVEAKILSIYGASFEMGPEELKSSLASLQPDLTQQAKIKGASGAELGAYVRDFQRAWDLDVDGAAGERTKRTLALVSASRTS